MLDNALINLSKAVHHRLVDRLGCAVNWGPVRKWMRRPLVERIARALEQAGFQRVVSTTGSRPDDPRRNDPVTAAISHRVELDYVLDLIDVEIARYNGRPSEGRFGLAPLESIAQTVAGVGCPALLPELPPVDPLHPELDVLVFTARIAGSLKSGRRPFIQFLRGRYTNPPIASNFSLIGQKVVLHAHAEKDIRTLDVFLEKTGASLGTVRVMGPWRREPHTLELRNLINRHIDDGRLVLEDGIDPVTAMHRFLSDKAKQKAKASRPAISREATQLARESQLTGRPIGSRTPPKATHKSFVGSRRAPKFAPQL